MSPYLRRTYASKYHFSVKDVISATLCGACPTSPMAGYSGADPFPFQPHQGPWQYQFLHSAYRWKAIGIGLAYRGAYVNPIPVFYPIKAHRR